jgi:hypothetical protein
MYKKQENKKKEVQKSTEKRNLNLLVFELLKRGYRPSRINKKGEEDRSICALLRVKKTSLQYYLSTLKKAGYIKRKGYGVWEILKDKYDEKDIKEVQKSTLVALSKRGENLNFLKEDWDRGHAFMFTLKLPRITNWDKRERLLQRKEIKYKSLNNLGGGQRIEFKGRKIHLKNNSILTYEPLSYLAELASGSESLAVYEYIKLMKSLGRLLGMDLSHRGQFKFKVSRRHHALVKNCLAKQINGAGTKLQVYSADGLWLVIDNSFNLHETELQGDTSVKDSEGLQNYLNSKRKADWKVTDDYILDAFEETRKILKESSELTLDTSKKQLATDMVLKQIDGNIRYLVKIVADQKREDDNERS